MKNTKIMNKHFILGAALLTAVLILAGCNHDAVNNEPVEQEKQSILVGGTFAIDGALPKELVALNSSTENESGRSASSSFSGLDSQNYECIVESYTYVLPAVDPTGKPVDPNAVPGYVKFSTGNVDFEKKTWNILLSFDEEYVIRIKLIKKRSNPQADYSDEEVILAGEIENIKIQPTAELIEKNLSGHLPYPCAEPVMLVPNKAYTEPSNAQKLNLKFRLPVSCDIGQIKGNLVSDDYSNPVPCNFSVTQFSTSGSYKIATLTANYDGTDITNDSFSGPISFLDSSGNVIYVRNETINIIPGFVTDTWTGDEPLYYKDSQTGDTYFNVTQEMLDNYEENAMVDTSYYSTGTETAPEYPVVLFDKSPEGGYAVFNTTTQNLTVPENAELPDGMPMGLGSKIVDFAIAPIGYNHSTTTQIIYTLERDGMGRPLYLMKYPNYTGYTKGQFVANLNNAQLSDSYTLYYEVLSMYADEDGYIYYLLAQKANANSDQIIDIQLKRINVGQNSGDYGKIETCGFRKTTSSSDTVSFEKAIYGTENNSMGSNIKIAKFNNYIYLFHVYYDNTDGINGLVFDCTKITPYTGAGKMYFYVNQYSANIYHLKKKISDTITYESVEGDNSKIDSFTLNELYGKCTINDVMIMTNSSGSDADLYALISTNWKTDTAPYGFGGIIKISTINSKISTNWENHSFDQIGGTTGPYIRGWIPFNPPNYPASSQYLYCPTKFVARKPDELVIADEVSYQYNGSVNDTDRVVVINDLGNFATGSSFKYATTVQAKFSTYLYLTESCGYIYAKYGEENNN